MDDFDAPECTHENTASQHVIADGEHTVVRWCNACGQTVR